jgi:NhaP-type Na+/H+ or K+/H+ antiporter/mannitol/fructose-specific phosphotransferase system IIA component (Ntr-type)
MEHSQEIIITFTGSLFFGILFIYISHLLKISAISVLLIGGIAVGPFGLNIINPGNLGQGLNAIIQIAVGLILFEGGLNLDIKGYRAVSDEIRGALTRGVLVTWFFSSLVVKYLFGFSWEFAVLSGSLIIVTGPTVIGPLLKRIGVRKKIHSFLHWEGVLIDPIGVFIALLCYEWIIGADAVTLFFMRLGAGIVTGLISGFILSQLVKLQWIGDEFLNVFVLASALGVFALSDILIPESGLLSMVIAGFFLGYSDIPQIHRIKRYKAQLIELLIGLLFILLAANLDIESFNRHYGIKMLIAVSAVMLAIRPLNIFISILWKKSFNLREKLFLSWVAPRGIVAASMASLFALNLGSVENPEYSLHADFLEAFTYTVIIGTVIFQGFSARFVGKLLGVLETEPDGWLIVGAHKLARIIAEFIKSQGIDVTIIDTNLRLVRVARRFGIPAINENAITVVPDRYPELYGIGNVLAITENEDLNELVCQQWRKNLDRPRLYKWCSAERWEKTAENSTELTGKPVWPDIQLNRMIAMMAGEGEINLMLGEAEADNISSREKVLICYNKGAVTPFVPKGVKGPCRLITIDPFAIPPDLKIKPEWVLLSGAAKFSDAIRELLEIAGTDFPMIDREKVFSDVIELEKEYTSVIGYNVALPHAYIEGIDDSLVLISKLRKPIECKYSKDRVDYIFLVLSPREKPQKHIKTLSEISKFIVNDEHRYKLLNAKTEEELVEVFFPKSVIR